MGTRGVAAEIGQRCGNGAVALKYLKNHREVYIPVAGGPVQQRPAINVLNLLAGAQADDQARDVCVPGGLPERPLASLSAPSLMSCNVKNRSCFNQRADHIEVAVHCRTVQWYHSISTMRSEFCACSEENLPGIEDTANTVRPRRGPDAKPVYKMWYTRFREDHPELQKTVLKAAEMSRESWETGSITDLKQWFKQLTRPSETVRSTPLSAGRQTKPALWSVACESAYNASPYVQGGRLVPRFSTLPTAEPVPLSL
ncbi:hypothetical protein DL768_003550 [Monosporascus sp. mg162]|nr:hypothetical protein DL768_003550 [Monosporascus sp. mg162]